MKQRMTKKEILEWLPSHWGLPFKEILETTGRCQPSISHYARLLNLPYHIPPKESFEGKRYGRITILKRVTTSRCLCRCDCGTTYETNLYSITAGDTVSCGCYRREIQHAMRVGKKVGVFDTAKIKEVDINAYINKGQDNAK